MLTTKHYKSEWVRMCACVLERKRGEVNENNTNLSERGFLRHLEEQKANNCRLILANIAFPRSLQPSVSHFAFVHTLQFLTVQTIRATSVICPRVSPGISSVFRSLMKYLANFAKHEIITPLYSRDCRWGNLLTARCVQTSREQKQREKRRKRRG